MALGVGMPSEDEFATCTMTGLSPYMGWCFPEECGGYDRYLTFRDAEESEVDHWKHALTTFFKKLTLRHGRPLVLKSPPHTARIRLLMGLFADARFVHIRRDPYVVFCSTKHLIQVVQPLYHLRDGPLQDGDDRIISVYTEMYDAYFEERDLIPRGRLCEVAYEDLVREPMASSGRSTNPSGCRVSRASGPGWRPTCGRSPVTAKTGTTNFPKSYAVGSPTIGAGVSTSGGTSADPGICARGRHSVTIFSRSRTVRASPRNDGRGVALPHHVFGRDRARGTKRAS